MITAPHIAAGRDCPHTEEADVLHFVGAGAAYQLYTCRIPYLHTSSLLKENHGPRDSSLVSAGASLAISAWNVSNFLEQMRGVNHRFGDLDAVIGSGFVFCTGQLFECWLRAAPF